VRTEAIAGGAIQGVGIGLRAPHYALIEREHPFVPWFEVLDEAATRQKKPFPSGLK
jgi:hypothetical protein